ncbi:MAG: hypothetical protein WCC64_13420 [Aliidongia sp.]
MPSRAEISDAVRHDLVKHVAPGEFFVDMGPIDVPRHDREQLDVLVGGVWTRLANSPGRSSSKVRFSMHSMPPLRSGRASARDHGRRRAAVIMSNGLGRPMPLDIVLWRHAAP